MARKTLKPKYRTFNDVKYKFLYVNADDIRISEKEGLCDLDDKIIYISNGPHKKSYPFEKVIEHESAHAMLWEHGLQDLDVHLEHVLVEIMIKFKDMK